MCRHVAQFYDDQYPSESISAFLAGGLEAGDTCLTLLTEPNRRALEQGLMARGIDLARPDYIALDTDAVWSQVQVGGRLDLHRAQELLAPLMMRPKGDSHRRVRAVGDLAPTLHAAGNTDDAVAFERLVHRLTKEHGASTICAYPIRMQTDGNRIRAMLRLSAEHSSIEFPKSLWIRNLMPSYARLAE